MCRNADEPDMKPSAPLSIETLQLRRERVFLVLAGLFLGTLAMLNILGITRFIHLATLPDAWGGWTLAVAVGVLPYPVTFLCTDLISELYGRRRANFVVLVGLLLNLWVVFILWLGGALPGFEPTDPQTGELVRDAAGRLPVYFELRALSFGAVTASMIAYLVAQFIDVEIFHRLKASTNGKHLWLRNNGSTLISQMVDTVAVILITHFFAHALPIDAGKSLWPQLLVFIVTGYAFKAVAALADTPVIYAAVGFLGPYLQIDPTIEHGSSEP